MIETILLIVALVVGMLLLGYVLAKKLPSIRMVDPSTGADGKSRELKYSIMKTRLERASSKHVERVNRGVFKPLVTGIQTVIRVVAGKLTAVERRYQERSKAARSGRLSADELQAMIDEGKKLTVEGAFDRAEKKFIEVISYDPKNVEAYEFLGRLYQDKQDYPLAKETFKFLMKLSPNDPSVITSLGELCEEQGDYQGAFDYYKKASGLRPNNPKYLDFFIEAALKIGNQEAAKSALAQLKKANPDNQKIPDFEARISDLE